MITKKNRFISPSTLEQCVLESVSESVGKDFIGLECPAMSAEWATWHQIGSYDGKRVKKDFQHSACSYSIRFQMHVFHEITDRLEIFGNHIQLLDLYMITPITQSLFSYLFAKCLGWPGFD